MFCHVSSEGHIVFKRRLIALFYKKFIDLLLVEGREKSEDFGPLVRLYTLETPTNQDFLTPGRLTTRHGPVTVIIVRNLIRIYFLFFNCVCVGVCVYTTVKSTQSGDWSQVEIVSYLSIVRSPHEIVKFYV